ncbi:hypothetical protein [Roseibacillus ishigakijimensis]|uniref:Carboxypeptidase regulatory-like domain-containing protein n=1 Tax=Roseibacillus ishigakijimensis TaxID=454146 RepID=A0A934RSZ7_9BACT|nr:hypothetical protein [Roseibacillus ishigakijimensis]MBK1834883.1 hypothetical protein [Roseibacillus ishigakijimensis]
MKIIMLIAIVSLLAPQGLAQDTLKSFRALSQENIGGGVDGRKEWAKEKAHPGYVCVSTSGIAWVYKSPPYTGGGHGDGISPLKFYGRVVDSELNPLKGASVAEKPVDLGDGRLSLSKKVMTDSKGAFLLGSFVGAALSLGEYEGDVYQSDFKTFVVSCEGYENLEITVGFGCPEVFIQLTPIKVDD